MDNKPGFHLRPLLAGLQLESNQMRPSGSEGPLQRRINSLSRSPSVNTTLRPTIECAETWDNNIFLGTSDGCVIHMMLGERVDVGNQGELRPPNSGIVHRCNVGTTRRIERLVALPKLRKLAVFCDSALSFYTLPNLTAFPSEVVPSLRGITSFYIDTGDAEMDESTNFVRICVAKRRAIQLYRLSVDLFLIKEFSLADIVSAICCIGNSICYADSNDYRVLDMESGNVTSILPISQPTHGGETTGRTLAGAVRPVITVVDDSEYLVAHSAPATLHDNIGVFITQQGEPRREPLMWPHYPRSLVYSAPHVFALLRNGSIVANRIDNRTCVLDIDIHRLQARMLVQSPGMMMHHSGLAQKLQRPDVDGAQAASTRERLFLVGPDSVTALVASPVVELADQHLDNNRLEEAIMLVEQHLATQSSVEASKAMGVMYIYRKAGIVCLSETLFDDALGYFRRGELDPRILAGFFPHLMLRRYEVPVESGIRRSIDRLESISHIVEAQLVAFGCQQDESLRKTYMANAHDMLLRYLRLCKESGQIPEGAFAEDIDSILLRLYTELDDPGLLSLLKGENQCRLDACEEWLLVRKKHYALSLLYKAHGQLRQTLTLWQRLEDGLLTDEAFGGLSEFTALLAEVDDHQLLQEMCPWVLAKDAHAGVALLGRLQVRPQCPLTENEMFSMVQAHGSAALIEFLEHLVVIRHTNDPNKHNALAQLYIQQLGDDLAATGVQEEGAPDTLEISFQQARQADDKLHFAAFLHNQPDATSQLRTRLLQFLQSSTLYAPDQVLEALQEISLNSIETCIALARLQRYEEALRRLVEELDDSIGAELFCYYGGSFVSGTEDMADTALRRALFTALLHIYLDQASVQREADVTRLLRRYGRSLDVVETLRLLPDHWSADVIQDFLVQAVRHSTGVSRERSLLRALAHAERIKASATFAAHASALGSVRITDATLCHTCRKPFTDTLSGCVLYHGHHPPEPVHVHCLPTPPATSHS